jgi:phospholipid/cholesterol/gamma-HCH transport system substrate-binding protein
MSSPYPFRHVNERVGVWVLLSLALLMAGVLAAGHSRHWFERQAEVRTHFPPEGTFGLQIGAEVQILGTTVGSVRRIEVDDQGAMEGIFLIRGEFARFVREDSEAVIKKKFAVAGDSYVEITVGKLAPKPLDGPVYLPCRKDTEIIEMAEQILERIQIAVIPALEELEKTLATYRRLGERLEAPDGALQGSLARLEDLLTGLERGEGTAGRLLKDPAAADQVEKILAQTSVLLDDLRATLQQCQAVVDDVREATAVLPPLAETVREEMRDVPGLVLQTRATLRETETLVTGVQKHWLIRDYVEKEDPVKVLSAQEVPAPQENRP